MKRIVTLASLVVLTVMVAFTNSQTGDADVSDIDTLRVLQLCSDYLGRDIAGMGPGLQVSVNRVDEQEERTRISMPGEQSRKMLRVHLAGFPMALTVDRQGNEKEWYRDYDIYLDDEHGKLIKIVSTIDGWQDSVGRSQEEVRVRDSTLLSRNIRFAGFPDTVETSLLGILRNCPRGPALSAYLSARYINYCERPTDSIVPIWVVCLLGAPEWKTVGPGRDYEPKIDYFRIIMDARTGKLISGGSF